MPQLLPIQAGRFDYAETFAAFVRGDANGQKYKTQYVIEALVQALRQEGAAFTGNNVVDILDVGCGPGLYAKMFLTCIGRSYPGKITYYGVDTNPAFIVAAKGEVKALPNVERAEVRLGNAFAGDPLLPAGETAHLAQVSHMAYHANEGSKTGNETQQKIVNLVDAVMLCVKEDGLALFFHGGKASDMHGRLGRRYGSLMWDAPDRIATAAEAGGRELVTLALESKLYFPALPASSYERLYSVASYRGLSPNSAEIRWLKLLTFCLHRDLAAVEQEGRLAECVEFARELLSASGERPCLTIRGEMQLLLNDRGRRGPVAAAVAAVGRRMGEIDLKTQRDMEREAAALS